MKARRNRRGHKTLLTASQIKRLGLKGSFDAGGAAGGTQATADGTEKATVEGANANGQDSAEPSGRKSSGAGKDAARDSERPEGAAEASLPARTSK